MTNYDRAATFGMYNVWINDNQESILFTQVTAPRHTDRAEDTLSFAHSSCC